MIYYNYKPVEYVNNIKLINNDIIYDTNDINEINIINNKNINLNNSNKGINSFILNYNRSLIN